jgi:hypothetical protein
VLPAEQEYAWGIRPHDESEARRFAMQHDHNEKREIVWAYGKTKDHKKCATGSRKSDGCVHPTWQKCGTNTYPAGAFPECVSPFGVYDLHGNAAEHMNFPMSADELASRGKMGQTEMKGSWFIFDMYEAHIDDCRWRAPDWHGGPVMKAGSHMNYHLGFRCCRDLKAVEREDEGQDAGSDPPPLASAETAEATTDVEPIASPTDAGPAVDPGSTLDASFEPRHAPSEAPSDETGAETIELAPEPSGPSGP